MSEARPIHPIVSTPLQSAFRAIPETPFVYWLRPRFFELLQSDRRLKDVADVKQGLSTADADRFTRCFWEIGGLGTVEKGGATAGRWFWYAKGGGYRKWCGLESLVVDWERSGRRLRSFLDIDGKPKSVIRNPGLYFRPGLTYSVMARGSLSVRSLRESVFSNVSDGIFPRASVSELWIIALLPNRVPSYMLRVMSQDLKFESGYVSNVPLPHATIAPFDRIAYSSVELKRPLVSFDPTEREFANVYSDDETVQSLFRFAYLRESVALDLSVILHSLEGWNERLVCDAYELEDGDVQAVIDETGTPAGWYPLVAGHEALPEPPEGIELPEGLHEFLATLPRLRPSPAELERRKGRLRALYQAGPGATVAEEEPAAEEEEGEEEETAVVGARIPIPTETFLEELSQKLEIHPISVYRLLEEMREQEGLVSPPEVKRQVEDYASVSVLRLLGYRWPEQEKYEAEHGPILDPELVKEDGILPLVDCGDGDTLEARLRTRLERQFGEEGAEKSLAEFRRYAGRELGEWLRRDFFKRHVQQFKQRPIAWHFTSAEGIFQAMLLYHRLSRATLQALRTQYAGRLIERLRAEQERARSRKDAAEVSRLQVKIDDVDHFSRELQAIEGGDELRHQVRCRWKNEEAEGRPGPYAPDIDDGVKVNIRPFQESGLLAMKQVIKKW